jgi:predicted ATP-grasp superfamily ATP-dependent carboligase
VLDFPLAENGRDFLTTIAAKHNLRGWLLMPTTDDAVALVSRSAEQLSRDYVVMTPPWTTTKKLSDKRSLYEFVQALDIDCPFTMYPKSVDEVKNLDCEFPVILKPASREVMNPLTRAKAWQVNNRRELLARYEEACEFMEPELIMVQEVVPGGGEAQFSYAALCSNGAILASVTARRTRQFPIRYGRASSYVETIAPDPRIEQAATRLLATVRMTGLVEVEFKRDARGSYKLLDVNPRVWTWHMLCARAGVDFPYLLWLFACGTDFCRPIASHGVSWMHFTSDFPAAFEEMCRGTLPLNTYLKSLFRVQESAVLAADDLIPGLLEIPSSLYRWGKRVLHSSQQAVQI